MADWRDGLGGRPAAPFLTRLVITGSAVALDSTLRGVARSVAACGRHASSLARLSLEASSTAPSAPTARTVLRDEVLELWRELASVSWQEARRAIDELDARTRPGRPAGSSDRRRGHRVKP